MPSSFILVIIGECRLRKSNFLSVRKKLTFSTDDTRIVRTQKDISSININKAPSVDVLRSLLSILLKLLRERGNGEYCEVEIIRNNNILDYVNYTCYHMSSGCYHTSEEIEFKFPILFNDFFF